MKPMLTDDVLRDAVLKELDSDPEVIAKHIWVTAVDGAVTLGGHVRTNHEKHVAVRATERIEAVRAVADDIEVREASSGHADDEIAQEIAHRRGLWPQSPDSVAVEVRDGRVILHGEVETGAQRARIDEEAHQLAGVRAVDNLIKVKPSAEPDAEEIERLISEAGAGSIQVTVQDGAVHLSGSVPSIATLETAVEAAWKAPGVAAVQSEIVVTFDGAA